MLDDARITRYAVPLREGGSLPGVVEADDCGTYVAKFRGAGQGLKVLVAEVIVAGVAARLGIRVPRLAVLDLSRHIARYEADEEVQDLLTASVGTNLGVDFLPGAFGYDGSRPAGRAEAEAIAWLDAFTANVDRTWANPNLLVWHGDLWAIDHGAALYVHHAWPRRAPDPAAFAAQPFASADHALRERCVSLREVDSRATEILTADTLVAIVDEVPESWLETTGALPTPNDVRQAYVDLLLARLAGDRPWLPEDLR